MNYTKIKKLIEQELDDEEVRKLTEQYLKDLEEFEISHNAI